MPTRNCSFPSRDARPHSNYMELRSGISIDSPSFRRLLKLEKQKMNHYEYFTNVSLCFTRRESPSRALFAYSNKDVNTCCEKMNPKHAMNELDWVFGKSHLESITFAIEDSKRKWSHDSNHEWNNVFFAVWYLFPLLVPPSQRVVPEQEINFNSFIKCDRIWNKLKGDLFVGSWIT